MLVRLVAGALAGLTKTLTVIGCVALDVGYLKDLPFVFIGSGFRLQRTRTFASDCAPAGR